VRLGVWFVYRETETPRLIIAGLELMKGFEPLTSSLPRTCSTTELHQLNPAVIRKRISSSFDKKTEAHRIPNLLKVE
jgi:hypothetical protein